jgi:hypothetical protein
MMDEFSGNGFSGRQPVTRALCAALRDAHDPSARSDLLFLEAWEMRRSPDLAATLRASQIRRANPGLAAAIEQELKSNDETMTRRSSTIAVGTPKRH